MLKRCWMYMLGYSVMLMACGDELGAYQLILDKQLLGIEAPQARVITRPEPVSTPPAWSREYRMTMITQDRSGLRVGIQNVRDQSAYLLVEGASENSEFRLISGDFIRGTARIRYRGVEHEFRIEEEPSGLAKVEVAPTVTTGEVRASLSEVRSRRINRYVPRPTTPSASRGGSKSSGEE